MAVTSIQGTLYLDTDMEDGYVRVRPLGKFDTEIFLSPATYSALFYCKGAIPRLSEVFDRQDGTFLLPRAVIDPDAASDLRLGLSLVEPELTTHCQYGPCILPASGVRPEGFSVCDYHATLMADWDALVLG